MPGEGGKTIARLNHVAFAGLGLVAGCASGVPEVNSININISANGAGATAAECVVEVDGERMSLEQFAASVRRWRGREVHLRGNAQLPYRCIGPVIYVLQRAPVARIGVISAPPAE